MSWNYEKFNEADITNDCEAELDVLDHYLHNITTWVDAKHEVHAIKRMETKHIMNCIRGIENGKSYFGQWRKLEFLKDEIKRREAAERIAAIYQEVMP